MRTGHLPWRSGRGRTAGPREAGNGSGAAELMQMRILSRTSLWYIFTLVGVSAGMLAACSRPQTAAGPGLLPATPIASAHLSNGDGATILSPSLGRNVLVRVSVDRGALVPAPNRAWSMVPGTLHAAFVPPLRAGDDAQSGVRLTLTYPRDRTAAIGTAHAPLVTVRYADGRELRWLAAARFDAAQHRVTADLPSALLDNATGITLALGVDNPQVRMEQPGPRYWDGKIWSKQGSIAANKKTVVLIHGIFSSVETAFPTPAPKSKEVPCPQRIAKAGGFEQVLGFDYAWNEPPKTEGPLFADFLKKVVDAKVSSLSVEAHSYGSVVSLAAIPKVSGDVNISNVVTLGGPLPLRGTPLANEDNHWRMGLILGLLDQYSDEPPSVVDRAFKSGMVASLATNSPELQQILTDVKGMTNQPHFVEVAGTKWICFVSVYGSCLVSEETFKKVLVDGSGVTLPWDGVVEKLAANSSDLPNPIAKDFALSHVDLECSDAVINWAGQQIGQNS